MKKLITLVLAIAMLLALAGCGGGKASASATPTIDAIKKNGKLVVMTNAGFPPFEYIAADGSTAGVDMDAAQKIADAIGVKLEIVDMDFDLLIDALKSGKGDLIASGMTATAARAEIIDFSGAYINMGLKVIIPEGSSIKTFADLDGKKIAVQEATTSDIYAQEHYKNAQILAFKSAIDAGNAVKSKNADCAIVDILPAEYMTAGSAEITLLEGLLSSEDIAMGVAKGHEDLLKVVNEVLEGMKKDGSLDASFDKHMVNFTL